MKHPATGASAPTIPTNPNLRMSSLEIAELMDKLHRHIMRDIKALIATRAITESNFGLSEYKDASGKKNPMYQLDFAATMILITGYDAKRRAAVINRWIELETGAAEPAMAAKDSITATALGEVTRLSRLMDECIKMAKHAGLNGRARFLEADRLARATVGISFIERLGYDRDPLSGSSPIINNPLGTDHQPVVDFIDERCVTGGPQYVADKAMLFDAYLDFCLARGHRPLNREWFFRELKSRFNLKGYRPQVDGKRMQCLRGIALKQVVA